MTTLLTESLTIPGVQPCAHGRGISIAKDATVQQLISIGSRLHAVEDFLAWAWPDFLATLNQRAIEAAKRQNPAIKPETAQTQAMEKVAQYCDTHQIDPKARREYLGVALFYAPEERPYNLPYGHYREVMWATNGDRRKARHYLQRAEVNGWSLSELRRNLRQGEAPTDQGQQKQSVFTMYEVVHDFARYAQAQVAEVEAYDIERCKAVLADLEPAERYIARLRERVRG